MHKRYNSDAPESVEQVIVDKLGFYTHRIVPIKQLLLCRNAEERAICIDDNLKIVQYMLAEELKKYIKTEKVPHSNVEVRASIHLPYIKDAAIRSLEFTIKNLEERLVKEQRNVFMLKQGIKMLKEYIDFPWYTKIKIYFKL